MHPRAAEFAARARERYGLAVDVREFPSGTRTVADAADAAAMADPDAVREATGWAIGGVPPFCHDADLPTLVDETLFAHDAVWAAAGTPEAVFPLAPETLRECADATRADVAEE